MLKKIIILIIFLILVLNSFCLNIIEIESDKIKNDEGIKKVTIKKTNKVSSGKYDYIGILEIESIKLKRGFVAYNSKYNDIKYNIQIIETSSMPDVKNGNLILAAHRGNSKVAFFNNLHKIKKGDIIKVYYQDKIYEYVYEYSYDVLKNGNLTIRRDATKTTITLITCKKGTNLQTIFIGYLLS